MCARGRWGGEGEGSVDPVAGWEIGVENQKKKGLVSLM